MQRTLKLNEQEAARLHSPSARLPGSSVRPPVDVSTARGEAPPWHRRRGRAPVTCTRRGLTTSTPPCLCNERPAPLPRPRRSSVRVRRALGPGPRVLPPRWSPVARARRRSCASDLRARIARCGCFLFAVSMQPRGAAHDSASRCTRCLMTIARKRRPKSSRDTVANFMRKKNAFQTAVFVACVVRLYEISTKRAPFSAK